MKFDLLVRDVFRLANGSTVLACEGDISVESLEGYKCLLFNEGLFKQTIFWGGQRLMLKKTSHHHALETNDFVKLTSEEAQNGHWRLICEN